MQRLLSSRSSNLLSAFRFSTTKLKETTIFTNSFLTRLTLTTSKISTLSGLQIHLVLLQALLPSSIVSVLEELKLHHQILMYLFFYDRVWQMLMKHLE